MVLAKALIHGLPELGNPGVTSTLGTPTGGMLTGPILLLTVLWAIARLARAKRKKAKEAFIVLVREWVGDDVDAGSGAGLLCNGIL